MDVLSGHHRCSQIPFSITGTSSIDTVPCQPPLKRTVFPFGGIAFGDNIRVALKHQARTFTFTLTHGDDIWRTGFHILDDHIESYPFQEEGKEKEYIVCSFFLS